MPSFTILYDAPHEAHWFRSLHHALRDADEDSITAAAVRPAVQPVLAYDRPDIVLLANNKPVLVVEETVEVPSGHNVGQRFARLAAAAEAGVPTLYFGPYVAQKHGGETAGPRYMNLRLFRAFDAMTAVTGTAITTINWPVDDYFEVRRDTEKDRDVRLYVKMLIEELVSLPLADMNARIIESALHKRFVEEREQFAATKIRDASQYDYPPNSVAIMQREHFLQARSLAASVLPPLTKRVVQYEVGMTYVRSDPYTGMAILYRYLYVQQSPDTMLVLWFPNIEYAQWKSAAIRPQRKDIRLYRVAADGILFKDQLRLRGTF